MKDFDLSELSDIPDPLGATAGDSSLRSDQGVPKEPSPTRAALRRRRRLAMAFSVVWMGGLLAAMGVATERAASWEGLLAWLSPGVFGVGALWLALAPGRAGLGPSWKSTGALLATAGLLFGVVSASTGEPGSLGRDSMTCGELILLVGVVPLFALAWALRRSSPTRSLARSALLGGAMGLVAAAVQAAHCPNAVVLHGLVGHGVPILVLGLVGVTAVRRLTAV